MSKVPNLFTHAPSELSQDAFFCWLLAWADIANAESDPTLHAVGRAFVRELFTNVSPPLPESYTVEVYSQWNGLDILAKIGPHHILAIKDKVFASEHSNQLERYKEILEKNFPHHVRALIYLKTGDQSSFQSAQQSGWTVVTRTRLLELLCVQGNQPKNAIIVDFLHHIKRIEEDTNRYRTAPVAEWSRTDGAYRGFFTRLQQQLGGNWGVVNPPGGNVFIGFWWAFKPFDGHRVYLQLEADQFVVKLSVDDLTQAKTLREIWVHRLTGGSHLKRGASFQEHFAAILQITALQAQLVKPRKFRAGTTMTVARAGDWRWSKAGFLDIDGTIDCLTVGSHQHGTPVSHHHSPLGSVCVTRTILAQAALRDPVFGVRERVGFWRARYDSPSMTRS
jgi:hypothetical protein